MPGSTDSSTAGTPTLYVAGAIHVDAPGGVRLVTSSRLEAASGQTQFDTGLLRVNAPTADFSGIVRCDTLIANSVVASSYTPGAGNLM
jgi:hypothetical protein